MNLEKKVDVVVNAFGKPYQTALALLSLEKYSGNYIDKIYFIEENQEIVFDEGRNENDNNGFVLNRLSDKIEYFKPKIWLGWDGVKVANLDNEDYRYSIRYQYGWEKTDKDYLFITHNDTAYNGDIIGKMLEQIGDNIAVGLVGQCWNCPAEAAGKCNSDKYWDYRPSFEELLHLYDTVELANGRKKRGYLNSGSREFFRKQPWPLPECRINEFALLINMKVARKITVPHGTAIPLGAFVDTKPIMDTGAAWFRDITLQGYKVKNFDIFQYAKHSAGRPTLFNKDMYRLNENNALNKLIEEYGYEK